MFQDEYVKVGAIVAGASLLILILGGFCLAERADPLPPKQQFTIEQFLQYAEVCSDTCHYGHEEFSYDGKGILCKCKPNPEHLGLLIRACGKACGKGGASSVSPYGCSCHNPYPKKPQAQRECYRTNGSGVTVLVECE